MAFIEFQNVGKTYGTGDVQINALHDASFTVERGELVVIVGPSGAGKTTLLNILGGMDTLTSGKVILDGQEISALNRRQLTDYRREDVGFVFHADPPGSGSRRKNEQFPQPAFRRRAAACGHRPGPGEKSQAAFVR